MRLDKFLADMNVDSRSELKKAIRGKHVSVNGEIIREAAFPINPEEKPEVSYYGKRIEYQDFQYYMMNKPAGVISASEDRRERTVVDLIEGQKRKDLFPVGRLDRDTEGLLLITNDGKLSHQLLSPKHHVDKVYFVRVRGRVTEEDAEKFQKGIQYDETLTALPSRLEILKGAPEESEIRVTIQEGKFHQIKKMIAALGEGKEVLYLKRLSMGSLVLDERLAPGEYRRLTEEELMKLRSCIS